MGVDFLYSCRSVCGEDARVPLPGEGPFRKHSECEEPMVSIGGRCTSKFRYLTGVKTFLSGMFER